MESAGFPFHTFPQHPPLPKVSHMIQYKGIIQHFVPFVKRQVAESFATKSHAPTAKKHIPTVSSTIGMCAFIKDRYHHLPNARLTNPLQTELKARQTMHSPLFYASSRGPRSGQCSEPQRYQDMRPLRYKCQRGNSLPQAQVHIPTRKTGQP